MKLRTGLYTAGLLMALFGGLAASGQLRTAVLFQGTFDSPEVIPEVGQFVASSTIGSIGVFPNPSGGNYLVFDDTGTNGASTLFLHGTFDNGKMPLTGVVHMHFEMTLGQADSPFAAGIVVDNATSDFIPASGPDADGDLNIAGKKSGKQAPVDSPLEIDVRLARDRSTEDWAYEITVTPIVESGHGKLPSASSVPYTGTFAGTRNKGVSGLAFVKLPGKTGRFSVDDINVTQTSH